MVGVEIQRGDYVFMPLLFDLFILMEKRCLSLPEFHRFLDVSFEMDNQIYSSNFQDMNFELAAHLGERKSMLPTK